MLNIRRLILLSVTLVWTTFGEGAAGAEKQFQLPPVSNNAALQYYQAFLTMPALTAEQDKLLESWNTAPLGVAASKLLSECQTSLMYLHRAATMPECDWGLDYDDGVSLHLPHLGKGRALARLAMLDVRRTLATGDVNAAGSRCGDVMFLARRMGGDHTLVSVLVCYAVENMVIDAMAPHIPELGVPYADAAEAMASLPPSPRLEHSVMCEKRLAESIVRQLKEAEASRPGSWRQTWREMASPDMPESLENIESLEKVLQLIDDFQGIYDELTKLVALPPKEFDEKYPEFAQRARAANPMAELLLPALDQVIAVQRRTEARLAMLMAAIAVAEGGPERLAEIRDPYGEGPFEYRKLDGGFELKSELVVDGRQVALIVGSTERSSD